MSGNVISNKMKQLVKDINYYKRLCKFCWASNDCLYDFMINELKNLEKQYPEYKHKNSSSYFWIALQLLCNSGDDDDSFNN